MRNRIPEMPGEKSLFETFPTATHQDWLIVAGNEGLESTFWEPEGGIRVPTLVSHDIPFQPFPAFHLKGAGRWSNIPRIVVSSAAGANREALKWLGLGADGIWFDLSVITDPAALLKDVHLHYCSLVVSASNMEVLEKFFNYPFFKSKKLRTIKGLIYGAGSNHQLPVLEQFPKLRSCLVALPRGTGSLGIASALSAAAKQLESGVHVAKIVFKAEIGPHFVEEIGRLRTLRLLWNQVCHAYSIQTADCLIHAQTIPFRNRAYEPKGNMIMETTAALAAVLGGCNVLTVEPADTQDEVAARAAVNVSNLLREESYLDRVTDPIRGAGAMETYVDQLSQKAWREFQKMMQ